MERAKICSVMEAIVQAVNASYYHVLDMVKVKSNWLLLIIIETYDVLLLVKLKLNKINLIFI